MFNFDLDRVALCAADGDGEFDSSDRSEEIRAVIGTTGDRFRDWFTRVCLYLVLNEGRTPGTGETVVIGTEYGNMGAIARLQREAAEEKMLSAQQFPNALTSAASAFVNVALGATGRNMTLNAAQLTPVQALWQALLPLATGGSSTSHLLVGDVYSEEAARDANTGLSGQVCRSGIVHGRFGTGDRYSAAFEFWQADGEPTGGGSVTIADIRKEHPGRNGAFVTANFLESVLALEPGEQAVLECGSPSGKRASATVRRTGA